MRRSFFSHRIEKIADGKQHDSLMVYAAGYPPDPEELFSELDGEFQRNLVPIEMFIIVADKYLAETKNIFNFRKLARLVENNSKVKCFICTFDNKVELKSTISVRAVDRELFYEEGKDQLQTIFSDAFRQVITELFFQYDVSSEVQRNFHYVKPSGKHTDFFLRASKIICSSAEVSFYALALLHLTSAKGFNTSSLKCILIDSPVMIGVASSLIDLLRLINDENSISAEIISFGSFKGINESSQTQRIIKDVPRDTLCLISASTSGGLATLLQSETSLPDNQIFHFLYLKAVDYGSTNTNNHEKEILAVCDLSYDSKANPNGFKSKPINYSENECRLCDHTSGIQLVGDHFEPAPPRPKPITIGIEDAPENISKFRQKTQRIFAQNIFKIGTRRTSNIRSKQFFIDDKQLLKSKPLLERLNYFLELNFPSRPQMILAIDSDTTPLAEYIADKFNATNVPISQADTVDYETLGDSSQPIVVCAIVIESGRTLLEVSRDLRNAAEKAPIIYLIFVVKSHSKLHLNRLRKSLAMAPNATPHKVIFVEDILLPTSNQFDSWRDEELFITECSLDTSEDGEYWKNRFEKLSRDGGNLDSNSEIFLANGELPQNKVRLQPGYTFFAREKYLIEQATQTDIFFCIASILQNLRTSERGKYANTLNSDLYHQGLLAPENFTRFNDSVLQAALLRACLPQELNYSHSPQESRDMSRIIQRILLSCDKERGASAMEFLLALGTKKIRLKLRHFDEIKDIRLEDVPMPRVANLLDIIQKLDPNSLGVIRKGTGSISEI